MIYQAPLKDIEFYLKDVHGFFEHYRDLNIELEEDLLFPILREAAKFAEQELFPLNRVGDEEGVKFVDGQVITPTGFRQAYKAFVEGGWPSLVQPAAYGGQGLPVSLSLIVQELWQSANQAWSMYPVTTEGTCTMLNTFGTDEQKERYLPGLVSGEWIGTMAITEPQAGSDVGLIKTRAEADADGSYRITGNKIFISSAEQDLSENVVNFVLARLPDAPAGSRGLSLFIVPKYAVNDDGSLGEANSLGCSSVEHKMGLNGSATCAMYFNGARGYLLGEVNRGLMVMFTLINKSRLGTAVQGQAQAEGAYQMSLGYARERVQGRSPTGQDRPGGDAIIAHPDIQRMLNTQRAFAEGCRALNYRGFKALDTASSGSHEKARQAEQKLALLTPILKGCNSEWGFEATDLGIQILGGHGYIQDWGLEQRLRDVRVTRIYEGTTGIQAKDFLFRKVLPNPDAALDLLYGDTVSWLAAGEELPVSLKRFQDYIEQTRAISKDFSTDGGSLEKGLLESVAYDYLMLNGYLLLGAEWINIAVVAGKKLDDVHADSNLMNEKIQLAEFFHSRVLPRAGLHLELVKGRMDTTIG